MSEEKDDMSRVSCSCMGVEYSPIRNEDGSFTERWACKVCGNQFVKIQFLKELRTRVASLEKEIIGQVEAANNIEDAMQDTIKELMEKVEAQDKLIEWHKQDTHEAMEWKRELQNRLSTLEKENEDLKDYGTFAYANGYEQGLFDARIETLEEAAKVALEIPNIKFKESASNWPSIVADEIAKKLTALKDFRAVKEGL